MKARDGKHYCDWCGDPLPHPRMKFCGGTPCLDEAREDARRERREASGRLKKLTWLANSRDLGRLAKEHLK